MTPTTDVQLNRLPSSRESPDQETAQEQQLSTSLPPTDHGKAAYLALASCAVAQIPVWGYSLTFGIFQEYYMAHLPSSVSASAIASIGTTQTGILYLLMPPILTLLTRHPSLRRWSSPAGLLVSAASLAGSAFAGGSSVVGVLVATQGALYALGCALLFAPASLALDEWFVARKGLAYGAMWAAKSAVGGAAPLATAAMLDAWGLRATLLGWAGVSAVATVPLLLVPRRPPPPQREGGGMGSFSFLRSTSFWMLQAGNVVQAFGYLMPATYLASYATELGLPRFAAPLLLAVFSLASVPGSLVHGLLGDRLLRPTTAVLVSSAGSAAAVFLLWGLAGPHGGGGAVAALTLFVVAYGFFAGGFSATWSGVLHEMRARDPRVDTALVFGMLMGGRGVGFVLSGPVSGVLLGAGGRGAGGGDSGVSSYGSRYGPMIICTGLTAVMGAWGWLWTAGKPWRRYMVSLSW